MIIIRFIQCLIKGIILLECAQRRATNFILNHHTSNYKSQLIKLGMLPLMYVYEVADILFFYFITSLKFINNSSNILNSVSFSNNPTRSCGSKLHNKFSSTNLINNSHPYRLPRICLLPLSLSRKS